MVEGLRGLFSSNTSPITSDGHCHTFDGHISSVSWSDLWDQYSRESHSYRERSGYRARTRRRRAHLDNQTTDNELTKPLTRISDNEFLELGSRRHAEYEHYLRRRRRDARQSQVAEDERRRQNNANFWNTHRRSQPDCDCERCRIYRGELSQNEEDQLGW